MGRFIVGNLADTALYHTAPDSGASVEHAQGVVVGVVSTLMAVGMTWEQAIYFVAMHLPDTYRPEAVPDAWRDKIPDLRVGR